ncbi:hypothetical protein CULT_10101 [[Clostridium] ultunense Esp]|nr:hypothetical protein CULT_10101 [[Clostridium] ultunense Esp]
MNPQLSFHSAREMHKKIDELANLWRTYVLENHDPGPIRQDVLESWKRSEQFGVSQNRKGPRSYGPMKR